MQGKRIVNRNGLLFETSWEVCNKVGGIYTVLSTKADELKKTFGDNLIFIGPDLTDNAGKENPSFIERKSLLRNAISKLQLPDGIKIRVGRWNIPGQPIAVLVNYSVDNNKMNKIFTQMWEDYNVDSLHAYDDYTSSCAFAVAAAQVIIALTTHLGAKAEDVIAHFDEWTTGMGLLYIKKHMPQAATVFTTHATSIGRSICSNGKPLYDYFTAYNGDQMAQELNMQSKHSLEKAAAHQADCFTTVSEVTAAECTQLLDITPQVVTPNGFSSNFVPKPRTAAALRRSGRDKLLKLASALTSKSFDDTTLIVATSGRNEYRNKGLDLYIDSMVRVDNSAKLKRDVLALILVPAWVAGPNTELLNKCSNKENDASVWPTFSTHRLNNEDVDPIFLRLSQLQSQIKQSRVTFVYVPCYLDDNDGVVNISYYNLLPAIDLSLFASYYEPWGYTPLESLAFGIPTIATDKSGFGQWILSNFSNDMLKSGIDIVARTDSNYDTTADQIALDVEKVASWPDSNIKTARTAAKEIVSKASWSLFINYYYEAYDYAKKNAAARNAKTTSSSRKKSHINTKK